ncbi:MAG TPA: ABC transporter substrate-binding protein [Stackebrandtia sp.]|uniref:ABC transporter substrate-binding protein n=1 Tax=Stackebrandtia sp. TaxID=2023065 RepID=UPI002D5E9F98|nr:ABC transporter substrate-binding protein [Stackebrandtia sp.]HZE41967.1 ABC transporter substrate-binding protein [Stackebrandtia sp.]
MSPGSRFGRRVIAVVAALAAAALALAGCSGSSARPGKLVIGVTTDANQLFPWKATQFQSVGVLQNIYGTLTEFDKDLKVVPGLAKSWHTSHGGKTLTLRLRQGVTFADGSRFDAADVKHSLDAIRDPKTAAVSASTLASVTKVTAPDAHTVQLTLSGPDASLPSNLASVNMAMLSSKDSEKKLSARPNGTGPFAFDSRKPSQTLLLKRNASYWGPRPQLDSVEFRVIPDDDSILSAMQAGNVQFAVFDDPVVGQTAEDLDLKVHKTSQLSYHTLQLNASRKKLSNVNTRLAIQCAVDREDVLDTAGFGQGEVTGPVTAPHYLSDPDDRPCPKRDLAKSARYLHKAGLKSLTLKTIVSQGEYSTSVDEAQNLKSQLADAHIDLDLDVLESGAYVNKWVAADFDAAVALNGGREDPDGMYGRYFTSKGNLNKVAGYSSPALDKLFAQGKAATGVADRQPVYKKVGEELEDNAAWIWLFTGYTYTATTADVKGFTPLASGSLQYLRTTSVT